MLHSASKWVPVAFLLAIIASRNMSIELLVHGWAVLNFLIKALARIGQHVLCYGSQTALKWQTHAHLRINVNVLSTRMQTHTTGVNLGDHSRSTSSNEWLVSAQTKLGSWHTAPNVNMSSLHERRKDLNISNVLVLEKIPWSLLLLVQMEHQYHLPSFSRVLHTKSVGEITILSMLHEFSPKNLLKPRLIFY